jgi:4-hydroxyphenylpyruvate dioxygenase
MATPGAQEVKNYLGLEGIEFIEFSAANPQALHTLFIEFGFSRLMRHKTKKVDLYKQGDIVFLLNTQANSFADSFQKAHGPSICSMGWRVKNANEALKIAGDRGARGAKNVDYQKTGSDIPAIYGIGDSFIYFIEGHSNKDLYQEMGFVPVDLPDIVPGKGFLRIDHLTNNVPKGTMQQWSDFYKNVFGFYEVRYFDINGLKTGLTSYALRSPCGSFAIPINEGKDSRSQIDEYLREYKGAGVQHLAFETKDILESVGKLRGTSIQTLSIDSDYYDEVFDRVPNVTEDHKRIQDLQILVDGDEEGYLLQIFTKNIIGPIFIEIIQRKNHLSFGEGNFGALFRSIEKDQEARGVL